MKENYFMGADGFVWFTGVVEDRNDPSKLGRVRVRCLGYHTESLEDLPTSDLPWAHVMQSTDNPAMQGLGNTPSFLVEGSWVLGFFLDATEKQQPIIMGSLPGIPQDVADHTKGFNDPRSGQSTQDDYVGTPTYGPYPGDLESGHTIEQPDTSMLGRGEKSEDHSSLIERRIAQQLEIPVATKPNIGTVSDTLKTDATRATYNEPDAKSTLPTDSPYTASQYPYNHVFESESGHVMEVDDTPDKERLLRYHRTGTFEEIHPDGQRVVKVVGKNYEIIADNNNVFVNGDVNLTATGNYNHLVKGDYVLEVEGNYTRKIHKSEQVKIGARGSEKGGGNLEEEINGNHSFNVVNSVKGAVGTTKTGTSKDFDITIGGSETRSVGGSQRTVVTKDILFASTTDEMILSASTNMSLSTSTGIMSIKSGGDTSLGSVGAVTTTYKSTHNETVSGAVTTTYESSHSETVSGSVTESYGSLATTISGVTGIKYGGDATHHYVGAFKEKIDGDTFVDAEGGKVDHVHPVSPSRTSGTDEVTGL